MPFTKNQLKMPREVDKKEKDVTEIEKVRKVPKTVVSGCYF